MRHEQQRGIERKNQPCKCNAVEDNIKDQEGQQQTLEEGMINGPNEAQEDAKKVSQNSISLVNSSAMFHSSTRNQKVRRVGCVATSSKFISPRFMKVEKEEYSDSYQSYLHQHVIDATVEEPTYLSTTRGLSTVSDTS